MTAAAQKNIFFWISFPSLSVLALVLVVLTSIPSTRQYLRESVVDHSRAVLATADADLTGKGFLVTVVKVKTENLMSLEIFRRGLPGEDLRLIKRIKLQENKDAYFNFRSHATNLVLADVDGDGLLEIVAPAFDDSLIPRLNVFKLDPESQDFFRLGPENLSL